MKSRGFFKLGMLMCLFTVFGYSYWATSWTASSLSTRSDWKDHLIFTPHAVAASKDIYEIDMFLYAFKVSPLMTCICFLTLFLIITVLIQFVKKQLAYVAKRNVISS